MSDIDKTNWIPLPLEPIGHRGVDWEILKNLQAERGVLDTDPVRPVEVETQSLPHSPQGREFVSRIRLIVPFAVIVIAALVIVVTVR